MEAATISVDLTRNPGTEKCETCDRPIRGRFLCYRDGCALCGDCLDEEVRREDAYCKDLIQ